MRMVRVTNRANGQVVASRVSLADGWWARFRGLLGQPEPGPEEGILLQPCGAVHMLGMAYPLDIAFLDARGRIVGLFARVAPGPRVRRHPGAVATLELRAGRLAETRTAVGDELEVSPTDDASKGVP